MATTEQTAPLDWDITGGARVRLRGVPWSRYAPVAVFFAQLTVLIGFSIYETEHFALTQDFVTYYQPWFLIAHGDLNPITTGFDLARFWTNHLTLIIWLLASLYWVLPHAVTLLLVQDVAVALSCYLAWQWLHRWLLDRGVSAKVRGPIIWTALFLLAVNPWIYWGAAFDFHAYSIGVCLAIAAGYAIYVGQRFWGYVFAVAVLACGTVVAPYLLGVALMVILLRRERWFDAAVLLALPAAYFLVAVPELYAFFGNLTSTGHGPAVAVGGDSNIFAMYSYIAGRDNPTFGALVVGALEHPGRWLTVLWKERVNLYANLGPSGVVGVFSPFAGMAWITLLMTFLPSFSHVGTAFTTDFAQNFAVYPVVAMGAAWWIERISRRSQVAAWGMGGLLALNATGWAVVWLPKWPAHWVPVTTAAAKVLTRAQTMIPPHAEVVVSEGVMGRFADRRWVWPLRLPAFPLETNVVYYVIAPYDGVRIESLSADLNRIAYLSTLPECRLALARSEVWMFRCVVTPGATGRLSSAVEAPPPATSVPAWTLESNAGHVVRRGKSQNWYVASSAKPGYAVYGDYWPEPPGTYVLRIRLKSASATRVEVWNATGSQLLFRRVLPASRNSQTLRATFSDTIVFPSTVFDGWSIFRDIPYEFSQRNQLEVRVWSSGPQEVKVYSIGIKKVPNSVRG